LNPLPPGIAPCFSGYAGIVIELMKFLDYVALFASANVKPMHKLPLREKQLIFNGGEYRHLKSGVRLRWRTHITRRFFESVITEANDEYDVNYCALHDAAQIDNVIHIGIHIGCDGEDVEHYVAPQNRANGRRPRASTRKKINEADSEQVRSEEGRPCVDSSRRRLCRDAGGKSCGHKHHTNAENPCDERAD
jgi:hypothetical protein